MPVSPVSWVRGCLSLVPGPILYKKKVTFAELSCLLTSTPLAHWQKAPSTTAWPSLCLRVAGVLIYGNWKILHRKFHCAGRGKFPSTDIFVSLVQRHMGSVCPGARLQQPPRADSTKYENGAQSGCFCSYARQQSILKGLGLRRQAYIAEIIKTFSRLWQPHSAAASWRIHSTQIFSKHRIKH